MDFSDAYDDVCLWTKRLLVVSVIYILVDFFTKLNKVWHIAGPLAFPLIGNCYNPEIFAFIKYFQSLRKKYGKIYCFWAGPKPTIVICDPQAVQQILTNPKVFPKSKDYLKTFGAIGFGNGLVTSSEEIHRQDRTLFTRFFSPKYLQDKLPLFNRQIKLAIEEIIVPHLGIQFDVQEFFFIVALRIFGEHALSIDFSKRPEQTKWAIKYSKLGSEVVGDLMMKGLPRSNFLPKVRKLDASLKTWYSIIDEEIEKRMVHLKGKETAKIDDCLTTMIEKKMPRQHIYDHVTTLCAAGHDTTAFFGCYLTYALAQNPEVQAKAKNEVKAILGGRSELTAEDIQILLKGYLGLVLQETLRLYSVIPFVKREASKETAVKMGTVDGKEQEIVIPPGVELLIPICLINRDNSIWQDPNSFIPERWEGLTSNPIKKGFFSFSYGTRSCIGMNMAKIEMIAMIGMLLNTYSFHPVDNFKPQIVGGISLVSSNGILVKVVKDEG